MVIARVAMVSDSFCMTVHIKLLDLASYLSSISKSEHWPRTPELMPHGLLRRARGMRENNTNVKLPHLSTRKR